MDVFLEGCYHVDKKTINGSALSAVTDLTVKKVPDSNNRFIISWKSPNDKSECLWQLNSKLLIG